MTEDRRTSQQEASTDKDLSDLLSELRILLPGSQTLTAFLIILPFNSGFSEIQDDEKIVYAVTFCCSLLALILFTAPAAHHRLQRPLLDRDSFKDYATKFMVAGLIPMSIALVLASQLVLSTVFGGTIVPWSISCALAVVIVGLWWIFPRLTKANTSH